MITIIIIIKKSYDQIIPGREVECFETRTCMSCRVPVDAVPVIVLIIMIITIYHHYHYDDHGDYDDLPVGGCPGWVVVRVIQPVC